MRLEKTVICLVEINNPRDDLLNISSRELIIIQKAILVPFRNDMNIYNPSEQRTVTPEKARKILAKYGTVLSLEEAKIMLDLLYKLSNLSVSETLKRAKQQQLDLLEEKRNSKPKK